MSTNIKEAKDKKKKKTNFFTGFFDLNPVSCLSCISIDLVQVVHFNTYLKEYHIDIFGLISFFLMFVLTMIKLTLVCIDKRNSWLRFAGGCWCTTTCFLPFFWPIPAGE